MFLPSEEKFLEDEGKEGEKLKKIKHEKSASLLISSLKEEAMDEELTNLLFASYLHLLVQTYPAFHFLAKVTIENQEKK